jgi:hypothetical protein
MPYLGPDELANLLRNVLIVYPVYEVARAVQVTLNYRVIVSVCDSDPNCQSFL